MRHCSKIFFLILCLGACIASKAQNTQKLVAAKHNDYGLVYTLPKTHLRIEVVAEQTIKKPVHTTIMQRNI